MQRLDEIGERIRQHLEEKNAARDRALQQSRTLIRHCSLAIRAAHRDERAEAQAELAAASQLQAELRANLAGYPDLSCSGGPFEVQTLWGVHKEVFCAGNERTFAFLEDVLSEVLDLFPSPFICNF